MYTQHEHVASDGTVLDDNGRAFPPPSTEPVVVERVVPVVERPVAQPAVTEVSTRSRRFALDSFITGLVGVGLVIVGILAVTRAGTDGPMDEPVVKVFGYTHTATLGFIELGLGALLLVAAALRSHETGGNERVAG